MRAFLTLFLLAVITTGCRRTVVHTSASSSSGANILIVGPVINSAGSWTVGTSKGSAKLDVTVSETSVKWSSTTNVETDSFDSGTRSGSTMSLSSSSDPWFIFVESPSRIWSFNGADELTYYFCITGGAEGGTSIYSGKLSAQSPPVPTELVPHLPSELRSLFPEVEAPGKRPSI